MSRSVNTWKGGLAILAVAFAFGPISSVSAQMADEPNKGFLHQVGWFKKRCVPCETPVCPPSSAMPMQTMPVQPRPADPSMPQTPDTPQQPEPDQPQTTDTPQPPADTSPFDTGMDFGSSLETAGGPSALSPGMLGDFIGIIYRIPDSAVLNNPQDVAKARIINRYKMADNASPIPQTRLIYSYNYFADAFNSTGNIHRNTFGAELAMLDDLVSVEIRQSIDSFRDFPGSADDTSAANLRTILKAVLYRQSNLLVSGGLGIGWPTGSQVPGTPDDNYYLSPFVGYLYRPQGSNWYVQGFEQLDVPTNEDDQMLLHTDMSIGYYLYEGEGLIPGVNAIIPTAELHVYTPLGDDPTGQLLGLIYQDVANMTLGTIFLIGDSATFSLGLGVPISEQKDYDVEIQCHLQWRFGASGRRQIVPSAG